MERPVRYIKESDHEKALQSARTERVHYNERERDRMRRDALKREADAYQRGVADTWKDALALLRRLSLKDATDAVNKAMKK